MRRPKPVSDPIFSAYQKEDTVRNKLVGLYRKYPRLVVLSLVTLVLVILLWRQQSNTSLLNLTGTEYSVVFDAGSTGSRVHVYKFERDRQGRFVLLHDDFHQVQPGLSYYAGNPQAAADSLTSLLDSIESSVPWHQISGTPCQLKATAGLRLLPGQQAAEILDAVWKKLEGTPYAVHEDAVSILDGSSEGAYAWLTLNYLLERLDASEVTVSAIDLGGGSVQESYEVANGHPGKTESVVAVRTGQTTRSVYVHSYLSYGLMAARSLILQATGDVKDNPCLPQGFNGVYSYGGEEYRAMNNASRSQLDCKETIRGMLRLNTPCNAPIDECTFNGVWGGPIARDRNTTPVYLFSYFWDRAKDVGIITSQDAKSWEMKIDLFSVNANDVCGDTLIQLKRRFPLVDVVQLPYLCMDLSYISVLLTEGFKLDPYQTVYLTKQINYRGTDIETSWTLGAAIDSMS